jgi:hypothetical protein
METQMTDRTNHCTGCKERQDRIEAQAAEIEHLKDVYSSATECFIEAQEEIERLRGHLEIWIFHTQRAMGQKPEDARAYAKAWLFRNANGEEPE